MIKKFQGGAGCMSKKAVLLWSSACGYCFHSWDGSVFQEKQFPFCAELEEQWTYHYFLLQALFT